MEKKIEKLQTVLTYRINGTTTVLKNQDASVLHEALSKVKEQCDYHLFTMEKVA